MKKALSILLTLALALSLAVTALAAPPTGDNVVKLTGLGEEEDYMGDLYMEFSQLTKTAPVDGSDDAMEYHIPAGSTIAFHLYCYGELASLDPDTGRGIVMFAILSEPDTLDSRIFADDKVNDDTTVTLTFTEPGTYQNLSDVAATLKALDPDSTVELYTGADKVATREDMVVMFWKHAGSKESTYSLSAFADADKVTNTAAWTWAVEAGLINGTEKGLEPTATLPKSHLAQLAVRYMDLLSK